MLNVKINYYFNEFVKIEKNEGKTISKHREERVLVRKKVFIKILRYIIIWKSKKRQQNT